MRLLFDLRRSFAALLARAPTLTHSPCFSHTSVYTSFFLSPHFQVRYLVFDKAADDAAAKIPQGILDPNGEGDRVWKTTSTALRDLLRCLLQKKPDARISASEALAHPWISQQRALVDAAVTSAVAASATPTPEVAEGDSAAAASAAQTVAAAEEEAASKPRAVESAAKAAVAEVGKRVGAEALVAALGQAAPPADADVAPSAVAASVP